MEPHRASASDRRPRKLMGILARGKFRFLALISVLFAITGSVLNAEHDLGYYSQKTPGALGQLEPLRQVETAVYRVSAYSLYPPELLPGEGREAVEAYCSTCHSTRYITMQPPLPAQTWAAEVDKMVNVMGQPIPEDVQPQIIKYLQAHYTPETRKR
jgi:hypothetical protein